ncbi:MAG: SsrA-binding protein SmpB [Candidatus Melainabacteria bacterium]
MSKKAGGAKKSGAKARTTSVIARNARAYHDYDVLDELMCGIVLTGSEIKSIRNGKVSMNEAFAKIVNGELMLHGLYVAPYQEASYNNHDPHRIRKLLATRQEINRLQAKTQEKGLALIPLKLFFNRAWVKVNLGLCKGKKLYDKRDDIKQRDAKRDIERTMKTHR